MKKIIIRILIALLGANVGFAIAYFMWSKVAFQFYESYLEAASMRDIYFEKIIEHNPEILNDEELQTFMTNLQFKHIVSEGVE